MNSFFHSMRYLKQSDHKTMTTSLLTDIQWWIINLQTQRPTRPIWPESQLQHQPVTHVATDASLIAGGAFLHANKAWIYRNWLLDKPEIANSNVTIKELAMINEALQAWAPLHPHHHFLIECNNMAAVHMTNSGATRHFRAAQLLRCMANTALKYDITVTAKHIRGETSSSSSPSISKMTRQCWCLRIWAWSPKVEAQILPQSRQGTAVLGFGTLFFLADLFSSRLCRRLFSKWFVPLRIAAFQAGRSWAKACHSSTGML